MAAQTCWIYNKRNRRQ